MLFFQISMKDLRYVLYWCDHNYAVTHKVLSDALKESGIPYGMLVSSSFIAQKQLK